MKLLKVKTYPDLLSPVKQHLKIFSGDTSYDIELTAITQTAIDQISNEIDFDLYSTDCLLTDYCFTGQYYRVHQHNINLVGITGTSSTGEVIIAGSACTLYNFQQYTDIKLPASYSFETITINYTSGNTEIPAPLKHAILIQCAILFDGTKDNETEQKTISRLTSYYRNMLS